MSQDEYLTREQHDEEKSVWLMFRVCMLGSLLSVAFMGLLYNVIDKGLDEQMKEITLEQMEQMLEKFDVPSEQIEAIEERDVSQTPRGFDYVLDDLRCIRIVFGAYCLGLHQEK